MFRDRIRIFTDSAEQGEIIPDWEALGCVPANITSVSGNEVLRGKQILAEAKYVAETRFLNCLDTEMRLEVLTGPHKGKFLNIISIQTVERRTPLRPFLSMIQCGESS